VKLRSFILCATLAIVTLTGSLFVFQVNNILHQSFDELQRTYEKDLHRVVLASLGAKQSSLNNYGQILGVNFDISGVYVVAKETRDSRIVSEALSVIQSRSGFDVVDIFDTAGGNSIAHGISIPNVVFKEVTSRSNKLTALIVNNELSMVGLYPLNLYDEPVGYVMLGYYLNRSIARELGASSGASISFDLLSRGSSVDMPANISSVDGRPVAIYIQADRNFLSNANIGLLKNLLLFGALCLILIGALIYFALEFGVLRKFQTYLSQIDRASKELSTGKFSSITLASNRLIELNRLAESFNQFSSSLFSFHEKAKEQTQIAADAQKQAALADMAQKVAHNIRSPVSALDMLITATDGIATETRILIRGALKRIQDIASNLLEANQKPSHPMELHALSMVLSSIDEKKIQPGMPSIALNWDEDCDAVWIRAEFVEFRAMLSNLLNNAIEACATSGEILVSGKQNAGTLFITIEDSGRGIDCDILPKLTQKGATFGKAHGSGLGLYHARQTIEAAGGNLKIESQINLGTRVEITLPIIVPPSWLALEIAIPPSRTIVALDDDPGILDHWRRLFTNVTLVCFDNLKSFEEWAYQNPAILRQALFLCDLELGEKRNGLDVIEMLDISANSILVTARYEDADIIEKCQRLSQKILPKFLMKTVRFSRHEMASAP
jgi:signal transduction histidine kinase